MKLVPKLVLTILCIFGVLIATMSWLNHRNEQELLREIREQIDSVNKALEFTVTKLSLQDKSSNVLLEQFVTKISKRKGVEEVSVVNEEREIVLSSDEDKIGMILEKDGTVHQKEDYKVGEILKREGKEIFVVQRIGKIKENSGKCDVVLPLFDKDKKIGTVHLIMAEQGFGDLLFSFHKKNISVILVVFIIGILAITVISRGFAKPIKNLVLASKKIAKGDFSIDIDRELNRNDEIGELSRAMENMVAGLRNLRQLEEHLHRTERLSVLGEMAAGAAHEIRNPLNAIGLAVDHLRDEFVSIDKGRRDEVIDITNKIKREIESLERIVYGLLEFASHHKLRLEEQNINHLLEDITNILGKEADKRNIEIIKKFDPNLSTITVDSSQIRQVFVNVIINSFQAMPDRGRLVITTRNSRQKGGPISKKKRTVSSVEVEFSDTGIGIAKDNLEKIFDPYFTTKDKGIGFGLSIAHRIVEDHGGRIEVRSEPSQETVLTLILPVRYET